MKRRNDIALPAAGAKEYRKWIAELKSRYRATQIEAALVRNITRTLTELGGGFAYVGHQVRVNVGGEDFWPDRTVMEYALSVTDKPMGVARFKLTQRPPKGLAEIKKAADRLGVVVDETFMESELPPKHDAARKGKEVSNG